MNPKYRLVNIGTNGMHGIQIVGESAATPELARLVPFRGIDLDKLLTNLRWLALAVSGDITRTGIYQVVSENGHLVATDGHRMHIVDSSGLPDFRLAAGDLNVILAVSKALKLVEFAVEPDGQRAILTRFEGGQSIVNCRFAQWPALFPEWSRVLPRNALEPAKAADLRKVDDVRGKCVIGEAHFNGSYIKEALNGAPKTVQAARAATEFDPVLFAYEDRRAVVMCVKK